MLEIARDLLPLVRAGAPVAAVTITRVVRSAPRGVGATLAVTAAGRVIGSLSGGCVEQDAVMLGLDMLRTGAVSTARFGFGGADDPGAAMPAGLACGGAIEVLAYPVPGDETTVAALERAAAGRAARLGVVASGPDAGRSVAADALRAASADAAESSGMLRSAYDGDDALLIVALPRPRLLILGAGEHAAALCRVGAAAGFAVTVCDAWALLVTPERFPDAAELIVALPHEYLRDAGHVDERTAVCVLTHDERLDVPALRVALDLPVGFVGAMGARATVARRAALLRQSGVGDADLLRLHSPLGLDLGGATPDETALSVLAEIVAARHRASARPLRELAGPVHHRSAEPAASDPALSPSPALALACSPVAIGEPARTS